MNHTLSYDIKEKCFTKDKIFAIATRLYKEFTNEAEQNNNTIDFRIDFDDKTSYHKNDLSIFDDNDIFTTQKITKFEFTFDNNEVINKRHIKFELTNKTHYISDLTVVGEKSWADEVFEELKAIISSSKSQNTLIKNYLVNMIISFNFLLLSISILIPTIVLFQYSGTELQDKMEVVQQFIVSSLILPSFFAALACALGMQSITKRFFPSIEFSFGPNYLKNEKNKKIMIVSIFSVIILSSIIPFSIDTLSKIFL